MNADLNTIVTLLLTASGGAFVREVLIGVAKLRAGMPSKEKARRGDVVAQRDTAIEDRNTLERERDEANHRAADAGRRADVEARRADGWEHYSADLREFCLAHGTPLNSLPPRPTL